MHTSILDNRSYGPRDTSFRSFSGISENDKQWLTGFWEGDGSVELFKGWPRFGFHQKGAELLEYIRSTYDFSGVVQARGWRLDYRGDVLSGVGHSLIVGSKEVGVPLAQLFEERVVSPARVEQLMTVLGLDGLDVCEPTWPWLAGFFDAEGSVSLQVSSGSRGVVLSIGQKDIRVLEKIRNFVGRGSLYTDSGGFTRFKLWKSDIWPVLEVIYPFMHNRDKLIKAYSILMYFGRV